MPKLLPDFMGIWKTPDGQEGDFFYFVGRNEIIDDLGLAIVSNGEISEGTIKFTKKYIFSRRDASKDPIIFEGTRSGLGYSGTYKILDICSTEDQTGTFYIEPYSSLSGMESRVNHLRLLNSGNPRRQR